MKKKKSVKKSTKKRKMVVHKPIVESSRAIEESYVQEKNKIDRAISRLERERLVAYIGLIDKRKSIVNLKKEKLSELEGNLGKHIQNLKSQISRLKKKKREEKGHFDRLYLLNEHLKKIEGQTKDVVVSRKTLLQKEKSLLSDIKRFFKDNREELRYHGFDKLKRIGEVVDKKTKILAETALLVGRDLEVLFSDKKILEGMTDRQLTMIYRINKSLKKNEKEHRELLKRRQELKTEDFEFEQMLNEIYNKRESLLGELKKVGKK